MGGGSDLQDGDRDVSAYLNRRSLPSLFFSYCFVLPYQVVRRIDGPGGFAMTLTTLSQAVASICVAYQFVSIFITLGAFARSEGAPRQWWERAVDLASLLLIYLVFLMGLWR